MLRVFIVEDEKQIREGLGLFLAKTEGVAVEAVFADAEAALPRIIKDKPDLVITDVVMRKLTGIDLIRECRNNNVSSEFIILSGYNEFEYAQAAIKYGVSAYLEKPVNHHELESALTDVKGKIEKIAATRKAFILNILEHGDLSDTNAVPDYISSRFRALKINLCSDERDDMLREDKETLLAHDSKLICSEFIICRIKHGLATCVLINDSIDEESITKYINRMRSHALTNKILCGLSSNGSIGQLKTLEKEAELALANSCINNAVISFFERLSYNLSINDNSYYSNIWNELEPLLKEMNYSAIEERYSSHIDSLCENAPAYLPYKYSRKCIRFFETLLADYSAEEALSAVSAAFSREELKRITLLEIKKISEWMEKTWPAAGDSEIQTVINYLQLNYMRTDITAKMMAQKIFMNPEYFSRKFKSATGTNYNEYVTNLRINKAKDLLRLGNYSVSKIAGLVGYQSVRYFSKVFKKYVGVMPKEYRAGRKRDDQ